MKSPYMTTRYAKKGTTNKRYDRKTGKPITENSKADKAMEKTKWSHKEPTTEDKQRLQTMFAKG